MRFYIVFSVRLFLSDITEDFNKASFLLLHVLSLNSVT